MMNTPPDLSLVAKSMTLIKSSAASPRPPTTKMGYTVRSPLIKGFDVDMVRH